MKRYLKQVICLLLTAVMLFSALPTQAFAVFEPRVMLPQVELEEEILQNDVFFLGTVSAEVEENGDCAYLLRVGRGGAAETESTALVKIADLTAKYGKDYVVRVFDGSAEVENPENNQSLLEMITGSDFEQQTINDEEDYSELLENDEEAREAYQEAVQEALDYLSDVSGLTDKYNGEDPYAGALEAIENGETLTIGGSQSGLDPVQQAANLYSGQNATPQRVAAESDMFQDLQAIANVMTNVVVGASVELTFAPGETDKYLEIIPKDNDTGDGDRMFYFMLGAPKGTTTNSAASTCAFTILDDEEPELAVVSFSEAAYVHTPGEDHVTVTVKRTGAINTVISVNVKTTGVGTADEGRDYSKVETQLVFPFGIDHLTLDVPVRTQYLKGSGDFGLALEADAGCVVGDVAETKVTMKGTYGQKASASEDANGADDESKLPDVGGVQGSTTSNTLSTYRTLNAVNLSSPVCTYYDWTNDYTLKWDKDHYEMEWNGQYNLTGSTIGAAWKLTDDYWQSYFLAGAEVKWWRSYGWFGGSNTVYKIFLQNKLQYPTDPGIMYLDSINTSYNASHDAFYWPSYDSARDFSTETRYVYPSENGMDPSKQSKVNGHPGYGGDHIQYIEVMLRMLDDDGRVLKLYLIKPILRPFQVTVVNPNHLSYLQADGSRAEYTGENIGANIVGAGDKAVFFQDDAFTVQTVAGTNVRQYCYLSDLMLLNSKTGQPIYTLRHNDDPSVNALTYQLNTVSIAALIKKICPDYAHNETQLWYDQLKNNPYANHSDSIATYVDFQVQPAYDYLDAKVTLRNPYDFPVTFTISGTDYTVDAKQTMEIKAPDGQNFHKGDCLAITDISMSGGVAGLYDAIGVNYKGKYQVTGSDIDVDSSFYFIDQGAIYMGEQDRRLTFADVVIEPNLQVKGNKILVRVKNSDLDLFVTQDVYDGEGNLVQAAGLLGQCGTVDRDYTYFTFADVNATKNGQLYAISAAAKDPDDVCVWEDGNTLRTYEGSTFYFKAGNDPGRNIITLTAQPKSMLVNLVGTLRYAEFNLRTGYEGNESNVPAVGAILAAGSVGGVADKNGYVKASCIPTTGYANRWLRYLVSANGTDVLQEIQITEAPALVETPAETPTAYADPNLLWDFNSDNAMSDIMGDWEARVSYYGTRDEQGNEYYVFTANGDDPYTTIATTADSIDEIRWAKIRAKTDSGANQMQILLNNGSWNSNLIPILNDGLWHEYVVDLKTLTPGAESGAITKMRLDPLTGSNLTGDTIMIDYVAFFDEEETAKHFRWTRSDPTLLWDFGKDEEMSANMGQNSLLNLTYSGESDAQNNDYYRFTCIGNGGCVSIDNSAANGNDIQWVKIRAKRVNGDNLMQLYAKINGSVSDASATEITLANDTEWHTYVLNIPETNEQTTGADNSIWRNNIEWIRLDPLGSSSNGSQILIDYIAFFPDELSANAYVPPIVGAPVVESSEKTFDISSNFPQGLSPVSSPIFSNNNVQVTARMLSEDYQVVGETQIPIAYGKKAEVTVKVKPQEYEYTFTGENGELVEGSKVESPLSVQLVVYDENHVLKNAYDRVTDFTYQGGYLVFKVPMEFIKPPAPEESPEPGEDEPDPDISGAYLPDPGDRIYLRLVTDRLAQAEALMDDGQEPIVEYQYSDVYTGLDFFQPVYYEAPPKAGLQGPIEIEYGDLPFVGKTGMNLNLPFVTVSITRIYHGYRLAIGLSPVQIADAVKGTYISSMIGDDGQYWKSLFSLAHPFDTFKGGLKAAYDQVKDIHDTAKSMAAAGEKFDTASLGAPAWRFDLSVGVYFDFHYFNAQSANDGEASTPFYKLDGVGGFVSITLGFKVAWYFIVPVVFIPVYLGIEIEGNVMGYLGAKFNSEVEVSYEDTLANSVDINEGIREIDGAIRGSLMAQVSVGVGLCGTIGVRGNAKVDVIANWEPDDPHGAFGAYVDIYAGLIIDLFLFSIPINKKLKDWYWGSLEYYANNTDHETHGTSDPQDLRSGDTAQSPCFRLRTGSGEDSEWVYEPTKGAFAPNKLKEEILVDNAYERPDAQLITLSDGETLVLAYLATENAKGAYQRTTLKLSTYVDGAWTDPVTVSKDGTADFQPSIAEARDGKILVAWVSPSRDDIDETSSVQDYLRCMDVYAAFVTLDNGHIKTRVQDGVTVADTEVVQLSHDNVVEDDGLTGYYDSMPTAVCDLASGDANVYYVKSGRVTADTDAELINPYVNDCVVCYMSFNAEEDVEEAGRIVPAGWLFNNFYLAELGGNVQNEQWLIENFGGQRFLDGAVNEYNERYAIPDFAAISYGGKAIYAYTVDVDGDNDTDSDKELYLQVYDFTNHETKFKILLTDDNVADAMPQFFRSRVLSGEDSGDVQTHTKLFWYRDGKQVVYIDVSRMLDDCINPDGSFKTGDAYCYEQDGVTYYNCVRPVPVTYYASDSHASGQNADFKAVEDSKGNLYILWTEGVVEADGTEGAEIFATGLVSHDFVDGDGENRQIYVGWSQPYRLTREGYHNDEVAVAISGDNLITVHNRYRQEIVEPEGDYDEATFEAVQITEMQLVADTLEPCGSVETQQIELYERKVVNNGTGGECLQYEAVTMPMAGQSVSICVTVSNNGINTAAGYKLDLYAGNELIGTAVTNEELIPNTSREHRFVFTLPAQVDGLTFRTVTQELRETGVYYENTDTYTAEPLKAEARYEITDVRTTQQADSFHACFTVTNVGNAVSSADDMLSVELKGPANLPAKFKDSASLALTPLNALEPGESAEIDLKLDSINAEMMADYGFINTLITVRKEVVTQRLTLQDGTEKCYTGWQNLSNMEYVDISLVVPMNMKLADVTVFEACTADIDFSMDLGDYFGKGEDTVTYAVEDPRVATIQDGKILGVRGGKTTLYATHAVTGATVSARITVKGNPFEDVSADDFFYKPTLWAYYHNPGITAGTSADTFSPYGEATRAQAMTFLWRAVGAPEPGELENPFTDVKEEDYYYKPVLWAWENGLTAGTSETTFSPGMTVDRCQFMTFLYAAFERPEVSDETANPFADVAEEDFYYKPVLWAVENGITAGTSATTFSPRKVCARCEIVTFLYACFAE